MGDLKPLGSEKLNGDEKLKRILELTYYKQNNNKSSSKPELVKESKNGTLYGIVKEKDGYYVKKGLNEQSLDYIGGMFMKNKNRFSSYAEALKRLELLKGQELIGEATKYVLKKTPENAPSTEAISPEPSVEAPPPSPEGESGGEELPLPIPPSGGEEPAADLGAAETPADAPIPDAPTPGATSPEGGESKRSDYMAEVQKYAGKLGQELRDQKEKMESDDIKYVLNMIISAVDLDKLDLEDLDEIGKKFDREEEEPASEEPASEEPAAEEPASEEPAAELGEDSFGGMKDLEEFVNSPISTREIDLSKYAMKEDDEMKEDDTVELDMDEIKKQINQSVSEILGKHFK